jgi:thiamine pyrophosphate-dependent acetolactate synthase large subunit-like protein
MRVDDAIAHVLRREGVAVAPCFPGNPLIEACARVAIRPIVARTERVAVNMADGYARAAGRGAVGVCILKDTSGVENAFAGVAQAYADSVPVLVLCGHPGTSRLDVPPDLDVPRTFAPVTKWSARIGSAERTPELLRRAFVQLRSGRPGPVLLEVPLDVAPAEVDENAIARHAPLARPRTRPEATAVEHAVDLLLAARRPVVFAGQGVHRAGAWEELRELAELLRIPVLTTVMGKGAFPEAHALALGTAGLSTTGMADRFLREADLMLAVGTSLTSWWMMPPPQSGLRVVQCTVDERDLSKDWPIEHALIGDAQLVLADLATAAQERIAAGARPAAADPAAGIAETKGAWLAEWAHRLDSSAAPLSPYRVVRELGRALGPNSTVTHDSGHPRDQLVPFYEATPPYGYIGWGHSTQLGFSLGLAMGLKLARPERDVVHVLGDAALGMVAADLETAARAGIGIVTVLLDNARMGGYAATMPLAAERYGTATLGGDFAALARALGVEAERVEQPAELAPALKRALAHGAAGAPALVSVHTHEEPALSTFW